jgi:carboxymethylenebutenolidase
MATTIEPIEHAGLKGHVVRAGRNGVLLLPTIFGFNDFARATALKLAEHGLTTVIWDPYPGEPLPAAPPEGLKRSAAYSDARATGEMRQWLDAMTGTLGLSRLAYVGFCLGGRYGLLLAAHGAPLACGVSFYPSIEDPRRPNQEEDAIALAARIACPVQVLYPYGDHVTKRATFLKLDASLKEARAATTTVIFPEAGHSFLEHPERAGPADKAAAAAAWPQALAFLDAYLT